MLLFDTQGYPGNMVCSVTYRLAGRCEPAGLYTQSVLQIGNSVNVKVEN